MTQERPRRRDTYRRRRRLPALVLLLVLAVGVGVVWNKVLNSTSDTVGALACPAPPPAAAAPQGITPPKPGARVEAPSLDSVAPAPPGSFVMRVLNANGQRGQAGLVSAELIKTYGFAGAEPASANDALFYNQNMRCVGQIRFGPQGRAQARTMHLMVPCAELVQDTRQDNGVELSLGTLFGELTPSPDARSILSTLRAATPAAPAKLDPALLTAAGTTGC
ncbi:MAG: envelope integrity protein Cei [Mycobacteriaceae bacterium]